MKSFLLRSSSVISIFWRFIPTKISQLFIFSILLLDSRDRNSSSSLKRLFAIQDFLNLLINERSMSYGNGIHPKHRLTSYHQFFISNISDGQSVIDVGCGYGAVSRSIASHFPNCKVLGLDINKTSLDIATSLNYYPNLSFVCCDVTKLSNSFNAHVVVLSNVLEHIEDRVDFLRSLQQFTSAHTFLIRVPNFERDWTIPLRKELNVNYFSDPDHKVEHTISAFVDELSLSGLSSQAISTLWGEIWSVCKPVSH